MVSSQCIPFWTLGDGSEERKISQRGFRANERCSKTLRKVGYWRLWKGRLLTKKGIYSHFGRTVCHRSGRNSSASEPQKSGSRCMTPKFMSTLVPAWMKMGDSPVTPPPRGRTVSAAQIREPIDAGARSRRPIL